MSGATGLELKEAIKEIQTAISFITNIHEFEMFQYGEVLWWCADPDDLQKFFNLIIENIQDIDKSN